MEANKFSQELKDVISYGKEEALRLRHDQIGIEHLLLGLIRDGNGLALKVLHSLQIDSSLLKRKIEDAIRDKVTVMPANTASVAFTKQNYFIRSKVYATRFDFYRTPSFGNPKK